MKKFRRAVGFAAALCLPLLSLTTAPAAQADGPLWHSGACEQGEGVTVIVNSSLDESGVDIRCALGAYATVQAAFEAAGHTFGNNSEGMVATIDGYDPQTTWPRASDPWNVNMFGGGIGGNWWLLTSTVDGKPYSGPSENWIANTYLGNASGPARIDQAYLWQVFPDITCTYLWGNYVQTGKDVEPNWVYYDPATNTFDEDFIADLLDEDMYGVINDESELDVCWGYPKLDELGLTGPPALATLPEMKSTHGSADAGLAAAWIASQLVDNVVKSTGGTTDWGSTIDAVLALASAGVGGDQIAATAAALDASGEAYIGAPADLGTKWNSVAKMAFGLEVAGLDPMDFGDDARNLITDLLSVFNTDGSFGTDPTLMVPFQEALAMFALARTNDGVPPQAVTWMLSQQCTSGPDAGSFGWDADCGAPDPDSTALSIQALLAAGVPANDPALVAAQQWLTTTQSTTGDTVGGWNAGYGYNPNSTGLAAQALLAAGVPASDSTVTAAQDFLGGLQITCDWVLDHPAALTVADIGAIATDPDTLANVTDNGLDPTLLSSIIYATNQGLLGMGGPGFATLSAVGVEAGLPTVTCQAKTPPEPEQPPAEPGQPPAEVGTGGATVPGAAVPAGLAAACLLTAAILLRRRVVANR